MKKIDIVTKSIMVCLLALSLFMCKKEKIGAPLKLDNVDKSIIDYLKSNPSYSILVEGLDKTGLSQTLNLYGSLTMFAPTNDAFKKFFEHKKISGLSEMNTDSLGTILRYHIYSQKFESKVFQTGSLPAVTISGDLIKMDISQGLRNTYLNNTVKIDSIDIAVTNGVVHTINGVLEPPSSSIYGYLAGNPQYSIMAEAVNRTGMDTALLKKMNYDNNQIVNGLKSKRWITAFFETNDVLNKAGINSFNDLAKKYSNTYYTTKNYTNPNDSLNIFVRFHLMQRRFFISDFRDDFMESISTGNWLIFDTKGGLNINKHDVINIVFNAATGRNDTIIASKKVSIILDKSNQVLSNGIIHSIDAVLSVYTPNPIKVFSYFAGAPEDRVITLLDGTITTFNAQVANMNNNPAGQSVVWWLKWGYTSGTYVNCTAAVTGFSNQNPLYRDDFNPFDITTGFQVNSNVGLWFEITTKPIFKGKYNLYLYEQRNGTFINPVNSTPWRLWWYLDGVKFPDMINQSSEKDAFGNETMLVGGKSYGDYRYMSKRKLGVFTFDQIKPHTVKFELVEDLLPRQYFKLSWEPIL